MSTWFGADDFSGLVGDVFEVVLRDGRLPLVLREVATTGVAGGRGPDGVAREQFSLCFAGPAEPRLEQATWELAHAGLGTLALFLVPVGAGADEVRYEAAFA